MSDYDYEHTEQDLAREAMYCDYCEQIGHVFSSCPKRDDSFDE